MLAAQRHHNDDGSKSSLHGGGGGGGGGSGMQSGSGGGGGGMSVSCSPAADSSQDDMANDLDDEKLDVVGTSDGQDGASSPLHISDGK